MSAIRKIKRHQETVNMLFCHNNETNELIKNCVPKITMPFEVFENKFNKTSDRINSKSLAKALKTCIGIAKSNGVNIVHICSGPKTVLFMKNENCLLAV